MSVVIVSPSPSPSSMMRQVAMMNRLLEGATLPGQHPHACSIFNLISISPISTISVCWLSILFLSLIYLITHSFIVAVC